MNELIPEQLEELRKLGAGRSNARQEAKGLLMKYVGQNIDPEILDSYTVNQELGRRAYLPMSGDPTPAELLGNRANSIANSNAILATADGPRYVKPNIETGTIILGPTLESYGKPKLAMNSTGDPSRQRMAIDMFVEACAQNPQLAAEALESMAGRKYEMSNAKGKEAHHMYPISYSARVTNALDAIGLKDEVAAELLARHLYIGDQPKNLAPLQTKANRLGPSEYLVELSNQNNVDIHDKVHSTAETLLGHGGLPVRTNVAEGSTIEDFIGDPNRSDFQKVNYAIAVPLAHRTAMQAENLDLSKEINQDRVINSLIDLAAVKAAATHKMSPMSENLLKTTKLVRKA